MPSSPNLSLDPYLQWSQVTQFAGHAACGGGGPSLLPFLVRADAKTRTELMKLYFVSRQYVAGSTDYLTVWVPRGDIGALQGTVESMEMALPIAFPPSIKPVQIQRPVGELNDAIWRPVIGVIDNDCAYLNQVFRKSEDLGQTRILGLWRQDMPTLPGWGVPPEFGYGGELGKPGIEREIALVQAGGVSESDRYVSARYLLREGSERIMDRAHGTHVLDTLAGLVTASVPALSAKPARADIAERCDLVFVDVPRPKNDDITGASSAAYLIDAIHYILGKAGLDAPVLINISIGALAGPHDGTSMVERAIDDILSRTPRLLITVAGGNARGERLHARGVLGKAVGGQASELLLGWRISHGDPTDSFLELWMQRGGDGKQPTGIEIELIAPDGGRSIGPVRVGEHGLIVDPAGRAEACLSVFGEGGKKSIGLDTVALATVAGLTPATQNNAGLWTLRVRNHALDEDVLLDAWVQRDDPRRSTLGEPQSRLEELGQGGFAIEGDGALSNLATSIGVVVVGAAHLRSNELAAYSPRGSADPGWRWQRDVDIYGAAEEGAMSSGLYSTGVLSETLVPMAGTSVAAPVAARYLARGISGLQAGFNSLGDRRAWLRGMRDPVTGEPQHIKP